VGTTKSNRRFFDSAEVRFAQNDRFVGEMRERRAERRSAAEVDELDLADGAS